jgi:23S rRNA pseudouridine1911/1915/1917 synthase
MKSQKVIILYEDSDILAINKPAGLIVHADGRTKEPSVAEWMLEYYPDTAVVGEPIMLESGERILRPGIVHRIDKETSGVLVLAKSREGFEHLKSQFQEHEVRKFYNAFVYGDLKQDRGMIDRPIGRSKNDFRKRTAERGIRGETREAVTGYSTIFRGETTSKDGSDGKIGPQKFSYIEARPKTGRTHQIRVHMKAIQHPLVCDSLYAPGRPSLLGFERLALHARSIEFRDLSGKQVRVEAPFPKDFLLAFKQSGIACEEDFDVLQ